MECPPYYVQGVNLKIVKKVEIFMNFFYDFLILYIERISRLTSFIKKIFL